MTKTGSLVALDPTDNQLPSFPSNEENYENREIIGYFLCDFPLGDDKESTQIKNITEYQDDDGKPFQIAYCPWIVSISHDGFIQARGIKNCKLDYLYPTFKYSLKLPADVNLSKTGVKAVDGAAKGPSKTPPSGIFTSFGPAQPQADAKKPDLPLFGGLASTSITKPAEQQHSTSTTPGPKSPAFTFDSNNPNPKAQVDRPPASPEADSRSLADSLSLTKKSSFSALPKAVESATPGPSLFKDQGKSGGDAAANLIAEMRALKIEEIVDKVKKDGKLKTVWEDKAFPVLTQSILNITKSIHFERPSLDSLINKPINPPGPLKEIPKIASSFKSSLDSINADLSKIREDGKFCLNRIGLTQMVANIVTEKSERDRNVQIKGKLSLLDAENQKVHEGLILSEQLIYNMEDNLKGLIKSYNEEVVARADERESNKKAASDFFKGVTAKPTSGPKGPSLFSACSTSSGTSLFGTPVATSPRLTTKFTPSSSPFSFLNPQPQDNSLQRTFLNRMVRPPSPPRTTSPPKPQREFRTQNSPPSKRLNESSDSRAPILLSIIEGETPAELSEHDMENIAKEDGPIARFIFEYFKKKNAELDLLEKKLESRKHSKKGGISFDMSFLIEEDETLTPTSSIKQTPNNSSIDRDAESLFKLMTKRIQLLHCFDFSLKRHIDLEVEKKREQELKEFIASKSAAKSAALASSVPSAPGETITSKPIVSTKPEAISAATPANTKEDAAAKPSGGLFSSTTDKEKDKKTQAPLSAGIFNSTAPAQPLATPPTSKPAAELTATDQSENKDKIPSSVSPGLFGSRNSDETGEKSRKRMFATGDMADKEDKINGAPKKNEASAGLFGMAGKTASEESDAGSPPALMSRPSQILSNEPKKEDAPKKSGGLFGNIDKGDKTLEVSAIFPSITQKVDQKPKEKPAETKVEPVKPAGNLTKPDQKQAEKKSEGSSIFGVANAGGIFSTTTQPTSTPSANLTTGDKGKETAQANPQAKTNESATWPNLMKTQTNPYLATQTTPPVTSSSLFGNQPTTTTPNLFSSQQGDQVNMFASMTQTPATPTPAPQQPTPSPFPAPKPPTATTTPTTGGLFGAAQPIFSPNPTNTGLNLSATNAQGLFSTEAQRPLQQSVTFGATSNIASLGQSNKPVMGMGSTGFGAAGFGNASMANNSSNLFTGAAQGQGMNWLTGIGGQASAPPTTGSSAMNAMRNPNNN